MADVLVVDNHDSFVHTLVGYLHELGATTRMIEADAVVDPVAETAGCSGILVSPGPGRPEDAGASIEIVRTAAARGIPLLGVCLGHQAIAVAFGARVTQAPELMHGITSEVLHDGDGVFTGVPSPVTATRYHSLAVDESTLPPELAVTARTASGVVMALAHRALPLCGVQFHPEAVLTEGGYRMLGNWLTRTGDPELAHAAARGAALSPHRLVD
ncbi:MAG: gamma-glutamyl-gamma-aminobutyrate hydrolase family protein [Microbacterium sp.]|uniref:anthranilate synthase component II n=1 Tax=Microbacterium sp. TaxID=51671 RepID=UPI001AC8D787|nr:gamma-glutamyl-gamma-aminobutyrate hydrolase family protein [Microbacterium sp.]MBN9176850.1 gamma-glutamyl-gamma-aminobutyrate hydrolase family protein [Microbacterium sp.]MBN9189702.1 gamma-glutamyl-gamma-aminobutyrate hydrolase family protein [Microbacterium sp.]